MIKQGSGMALFLKFVSNKVPSAAPLIIRRSRVSVCNEPLTKSSFTSPLASEVIILWEGNNDTSSLVSDCSIRNSKNCGGALSLKCDSDVIRYVSYLIFENNDSHTIKPNPNACNRCSDSMFGVPYRGTSDDFKFRNIYDFKKSSFLNENGEHEYSTSCFSGFGVKNSVPPGQDFSLLKVENTVSNSHPKDPFQPPSEEQLTHIHRTLANDLPSFFIKPLDLKIYHPNIVFEDNIRGKKFVGLPQYNIQAKLLYIIGHLRFMYIKFDVLKITSHPEDGTVKVRWKISVLRVSRFWDLKFIEMSNRFSSFRWIHGFSTYYVMGDGLVHKHVADKVTILYL
ncbi:hypothetical protein ONE63_003660 [Megalurothrips usitatus]|uniref:Uncharacterized protein n=1 Tax=Megalurothrips usitatus TaxID=439358 RepID=A0AAV7X4H4_9NEOP|nr:hypothetical protein ONE63_003660 [Megalurothrips usitatus]